jgi:hypothetical protein
MAEDFPGVAVAAISKLLFEAPFVVGMGEDQGGNWTNRLLPVEVLPGEVQLI